MNRTTFVKTLMLASFVGLSSTAAPTFAAGTPAEAEAMVKRAVTFIKEKGPDAAYSEFTNGSSFKDGDLYVSVFNMDGVNLAHGFNPKLVGKNLIDLKDVNGVELIKVQRAIAQGKGKGWTPVFQYMNPTTKRLQDKSSYVERLNDTWVSVGAYK